MQFIELHLGSHEIVHGFDSENNERIERIETESFSKKLVSVERILSVSERYILISYAYDRIIYWEYKESFDELKQKLSAK